MQLKLNIIDIQFAHNIAGQVRNSANELRGRKDSHVDKIIPKQSLFGKEIVSRHLGLETVH